MVIPKVLRERVGLNGPAVVELTADGAAIRLEPVGDDTLVEDGGFLLIPVSGTQVDDDLVRALKDADQR